MKDVKCEINGLIYRFTNVVNDGGVPYGYCSKLRQHAWIHEKFIQTEDGNMVAYSQVEDE